MANKAKAHLKVTHITKIVAINLCVWVVKLHYWLKNRSFLLGMRIKSN